MNAIMPILPLDHPEPLAATLGIMLYPGEDDASQKRARAYAAQFLAEPVERFLEAGGTLTAEVLARLHADCGVPLDDVKARWRDGTATGQLFEIYFKLAHTHRKLASWENAVRLVRANAVKHGVSASRSLLHQARSRYRSVMHLWGAWCMRGRAIRSNPDAGYDGWNDFQFFLTEAEILLKWGRTWQPERANAEPPLSGEAWRVPEGLTAGAAESLAVKAYRFARTDGLSARGALERCLATYRPAVPSDVMAFQIALAVGEASDISLVPDAYRALVE